MNIFECKTREEIDNKIKEIKRIDPKFSINTSNESHEMLFVMEINEDVIGYSIVSPGKNTEMKCIYVYPQIRNNGYGTKLVSFVINSIINYGYDSIVVKEHPKMNNFLEKLNFLRVGDDYLIKNLSIRKKKEKKLVLLAFFSFGLNILLASMKIIFGKIFFSSSLLADGFNSFTDSITNFLVIIGLKVGNKTEDKNHPFGYGKLESVFSVIIGAFIVMTAFDIIISSIKKIIDGSDNINVTPILILITLISITIKIIQYSSIRITLKKEKSLLMKSLLKDYKMDILITTSVLIGIILSKYISHVFDVIVGLLVSLYIFKEGYELISEHAKILLDNQDEKLLDEIKQMILEFEEIENAHDYHMTQSGENIFIYADIRVNKEMTVEEAHKLTDRISKKIRNNYRNIKRVLLHIEPVYD